MSILGEIKREQDLGFRGTSRMIWHACEGCGKERWVQLYYDKPKHILCNSCANKIKQTGRRKGNGLYKDGYMLIHIPEHPRANKRGVVKRAILVLEEKLGRPLLPNMISHHRNNIRDDDNPENLEELTRAEHMRLHRGNA